jgi:hypothetical protein
VSGLVTSNLTIPLTTTSGNSLQGTGPAAPTGLTHPKGGKHRPVRRGHNKAVNKMHATAQTGHKLVAQNAAVHGPTATRHRWF